MSIGRLVSNLWRRLFQREKLERELDDELRSYLDMLVDEKTAAGMDPAAARREARIELEGLEQVKLQVRDVQPWRPLADFLLDLRFALRSLAKRPGFTALAVMTLGLGLGVNTAIFCVFNAVLVRPLPYQDPERLVHLFEVTQDREFSRREFSYQDYRDLKESSVFLDAAGYNGGSVTISGTAPDRLSILEVTDNFFDLLGIVPARGRAFARGESGPRALAARVVMLTHGSWRRRFGADPDMVGQTLQLNGEPYEVIGILPSSFEFPLRGAAELVLPLDVSPEQEERRYWHWLDVVARLKPGQSARRAELDMSDLARRFQQLDPQGHRKISLTTVTLHEEVVGPVRPALLLLAGTVGLVLLIVCANVASLMMARAAARRQEMGIRAALGAGRGRLFRQLLTESALLGFFAGLAGLAAARWMVDWLVAGIPQQQLQRLPHLQEVSLDLPVLAFGLGLALATGGLLGLVPVWKSARMDVPQALTGTRTVGGRRRARLQQWLVASEVALALVLLVGAGLLTKSLVRLLEVSPGFETRGLLTMRISVPASRYGQTDRLALFHRQLLGRLETTAGVDSAAAVSQIPLTGRGDTGAFTIVGRDPEERTEVNIRFVSPNYFAVLGIPLLQGRDFGSSDEMGKPPVVLVNQMLSQRVFGEAGALGRRIVFGFFDGRPEWEIVGVVGDEKVDHLAGGTTPVVYFTMQQIPFNTFSLMVRTTSDPAAAEQAIRAKAAGLDADIPIFGFRTLEAIISDSFPIFVRRYLMFLLGSFAVLATLLAAVGIYGALANFVAARRREIGIRIALGAGRGEILRLVAGQGLGPAALGTTAGLAGAAGLSRLLSSLLFEAAPWDPAVLAGAAAFFGLVALIACAVPALRASRIDPNQALRYE